MTEEEKAARRAQTKQWLEELRETRRPQEEKARVITVPPVQQGPVLPKEGEETTALANYMKLSREQTRKKIIQRARRQTG